MARRQRQRDRPAPDLAARAQTRTPGAGKPAGLTASSFERARRLAFDGHLAAAERVLASEQHSASKQDADRLSWLLSYVLAARGDFAQSLALAWPVATRARDREIRRAASITVASVLRQAGRHPDAHAHDRRALRLSRTGTERAHAAVGLAADAIGVGDARTAARWIARATADARSADARLRVRLDWVRAEHALLTDEASAAVRFAARAVERARDAGLRRHEAKSLLFHGAALQTAGDPAARRVFRSAAARAERIGARPIAQAARGLLDRMPR